MTIEKLAKLATANVSKEFKARWLRWWNSSLTVRDGNCFPTENPVKEKTLDAWLPKASFWAQVNLFTISFEFAHGIGLKFDSAHSLY